MKQQLPFSAQLRRYRHLARRVNRLLQSGEFYQLAVGVRQKMLRQLRHRLKSVGHFFPETQLKKAMGGLAFLLGGALLQPLQAQTFAPPVEAPFGLVAGVTVGFPAFSDVDGDGDSDLFLAVNGQYGSEVSFFENTGTPAVPEFIADGAVLNPFGIQPPEFVTTLAMADLDNDGDQDALFGTYYDNGFVFLENTGGNVSPAFAAAQDNPFGLVPTGDISVPILTDIDGDLDFDLLSTEQYGDFLFFENTGTPEAPQFAAPLTNPFGLTSSDLLVFPAVADFDNDGDQDVLYLGYDYYTSSVHYSYQENVGGNSDPSFSDPVLAPFGLGAQGFPIPVAADIDNDGDQDLLENNYYNYTLYFIENTLIDVAVPPVAGDGAISIAEDAVFTFSAGDFNFSDPNGGDALQAVEIFTLPLQGSFLYNGSLVTAGQVIEAENLELLTYQPDLNQFGPDYDVFLFNVSDGALWSEFNASIVLSVTPVNDAPSSEVTIVTGPQDMVLAFSAADFPYADVEGDVPAGIKIVTLPNAGALQLNGTAVTANQTIPAAQLNLLTFTPAAGAFGTPYTDFQFQVSDGQALSAVVSMVINIEEASAVGDAWPAATVSVSPNPASEFITLEVTATSFDGPVEAKFFDAQGRALGQLQLQNAGLSANGKMDVGRWAAGMYSVKIQAGRKMKTVKFIKK